MERISISSYYKNAKCEKMAEIDALSASSRNLYLAKEMAKVCECLCRNVSREEVLKSAKVALTEAYASLESGFAWRHEAMAKQDAAKIARLLNWMEAEKLRPVAHHVKTEVYLAEKDLSLTGKVDLIVVAEDGHHECLIIHPGASKRSVKGQKVHTRADGDLNAVVAKCALESKYPGIVIDTVYLTHTTDGERVDIDAFRVTDTTNSNLHRIPFRNFYDGDEFDREAVLARVAEIVAVPIGAKCDDCRCAFLCKTPLLYDKEEMEIAEEKRAEMPPVEKPSCEEPKFTADQLEVVNHKEGPLLVCAGPGSGKTTTLVWRIKRLIESGVMPEFILVVTFTNEAANEVRQRCLSFLKEEDLPTIATLNSFCYGILKEQKHLLKNGLQILSSRAQMEILREIVTAMPPLKGFKYGMEYGKNGLYKTILNRMKSYRESPDEFFFKNPEVDRREFAELVEMYDLAIKEGGYITFDQQISYVNLLFKHYPDILSCYQDIYQYIMVDEYQDVDAEQVGVLYALAGERKNLVVVGDDDQNIYAFRGGDVRFMLNFCSDMGGAKKVILRDNFRSTKALVEASNSLIRLNKERIDKDIRAFKDGGKQPVLVPSLDTAVTMELIEGLVKDGYSYGDIAIISPRNLPLEVLHKELKLPTVLAKSFLCNDAFFLLIYNVLRLYFNKADDTAFYQYLRLYGEKPPSVTGVSLLEAACVECGLSSIEGVAEGMLKKDSPYAKPLEDLYSYFLLVGACSSLYELLDTLTIMCNWRDSDVVGRLTEEIRNNSISTPEELLRYMQELVLFEDETKVETEVGNRILLITSHDSKGKEFPIVIVRNDFKRSSSDGPENTRRLVYVATTRAKERLYLMQPAAGVAEDIGSELPHEKMEV